MRDVGYDVLRGVERAAGVPGTVQVKRMRALLHSALNSCSLSWQYAHLHVHYVTYTSANVQ